MTITPIRQTQVHPVRHIAGFTLVLVGIVVAVAGCIVAPGTVAVAGAGCAASGYMVSRRWTRRTPTQAPEAAERQDRIAA